MALTQINVEPGTELVPAATYDGWHLDELSITFSSYTIAGLGKFPHIFAIFVPWKDDGEGGKIAYPEHRRKVSISDPARVSEVYDFYVEANAQLGPVIENMVWREAQAQLEIPQSEIDALPVVTSENPF